MHNPSTLRIPSLPLHKGRISAWRVSTVEKRRMAKTREDFFFILMFPHYLYENQSLFSFSGIEYINRSSLRKIPNQVQDNNEGYSE